MTGADTGSACLIADAACRLCRSNLFQIAAVCCLLLAFSAWNQHSLHRHQIERDKLIKKIQRCKSNLTLRCSSRRFLILLCTDIAV